MSKKWRSEVESEGRKAGFKGARSGGQMTSRSLKKQGREREKGITRLKNKVGDVEKHHKGAKRVKNGVISWCEAVGGRGRRTSPMFSAATTRQERWKGVRT